jgi:hypothetical protein
MKEKKRKKTLQRARSNGSLEIQIMKQTQLKLDTIPFSRGENRVYFLFFLVSLVVERGGSSRLREQDERFG